MSDEIASAINKTTVARYWLAANARDWDIFASLLHHDVVYEVPQTRERLRGRDNYVEFNASYPGDWDLVVKNLIASETQAVSRIAFSNDGEVATGVSFFELRDGLISRITDYWPEAYEPPARHTVHMQRY
ncbi:MAG: nuclear transport factor 2 family protein [Pseudomonadota bacterium]